MPKPLRYFGDVIGGDLSKSDDIPSPVMKEKAILRDIAEHRFPLGRRERRVGTQGGKDIHRRASLGQEMVAVVRDRSRPGMVAGIVRGQDQHLLWIPALHGTKQTGADILFTETLRSLRDPIKLHSYTPE